MPPPERPQARTEAATAAWAKMLGGSVLELPSRKASSARQRPRRRKPGPFIRRPRFGTARARSG